MGTWYACPWCYEEIDVMTLDGLEVGADIDNVLDCPFCGAGVLVTWNSGFEEYELERWQGD